MYNSNIVRILIALTCAVLLFAGITKFFNSPDAAYQRVKLGMTLQQVEAALGKGEPELLEGELPSYTINAAMSIYVWRFRNGSQLRVVFNKGCCAAKLLRSADGETQRYDGPGSPTFS